MKNPDVAAATLNSMNFPKLWKALMVQQNHSEDYHLHALVACRYDAKPDGNWLNSTSSLIINSIVCAGFSPRLTFQLTFYLHRQQTLETPLKVTHVTLNRDFKSTGSFLVLPPNKPKAHCHAAKHWQDISRRLWVSMWWSKVKRMEEMGWQQREKRRERKLDSYIFSLGKNQVWGWRWARHLQQPQPLHYLLPRCPEVTRLQVEPSACSLPPLPAPSHWKRTW